MLRTRVKICGITNVDDARAAVSAGADAVGVIVYPPSPRHVNSEVVADIRAVVPAFVSLTLVSVDLERDELERWMELMNPDLLQFHGKETPETVGSYGRPGIKSVRMRDDVDLESIQTRYCSASSLLLDTYVPGIVGGTGETFAWSRARAVSKLPVILAGGLNADSVAKAIDQAYPYALDVSSSLEAEPGIKNHQAMFDFVDAVRSADLARHNSVN